METGVRIRYLQQLKAWNRFPTENKPIVWEWFADWIFHEPLKNRDYKLFKDGYDTMVSFTMICEKLNLQETFERIDGNLNYICNRFNKRNQPFHTYLKKHQDGRTKNYDTSD